MKTFSINNFYETENTGKNYEESLFESIWERLGEVDSFPKEFVYSASAQECKKTSQGKLNEKAGHSECQVFSRNSSRTSSPLTWDTPSPNSHCSSPSPYTPVPSPSPSSSSTATSHLPDLDLVALWKEQEYLGEEKCSTARSEQRAEEANVLNQRNEKCEKVFVTHLDNVLKRSLNSVISSGQAAVLPRSEVHSVEHAHLVSQINDGETSATPPTPTSTPTSASAGRGRGLKRTPPPVNVGGGGLRAPGTAPPGGGGGGRGGGDGRTPQTSPLVGRARLKLVVNVSPESFGVTAPEHTKATCGPLWMQQLAVLFDKIRSDHQQPYKWNLAGEKDEEGDVNATFIAMMVIFIAHKNLPTSGSDYNTIDFFNYDASGFICGSKLANELRYVLSGVSRTDCFEFFTPLDKVKGDLPAEIYLRPALVLLTDMLEQLQLSNVEVEINMTHGSPRTDNPATTKFKSNLIFGVLLRNLKNITNILNELFLTQRAAQELAETLRGVENEQVDNFEADICHFILSPGEKDEGKLKKKIREALEAANQASSQYSKYEKRARDSYDGTSLNEEGAVRTFSEMSNLIDFMDNNCSPSMPWIQSPDRLLGERVAAQVLLGDVVLKPTHSPSRILIPRSLTCVDKQVNKMKELVNKAMQAIKDMNEDADRSHYERTLSPRHFDTKDVYPKGLIEDAKELNQMILERPDVNENAPEYILVELIDKIKIVTTEVQKQEWAGIVLKEEDKHVLRSLNSLKTALLGFQKKQQERQKTKEAQEREVSRSLTISKTPILKEDGSNIRAWLDYFECYKSATPLARSFKLKEGLSSKLQTRFENVNDPEEIINILSGLYLASDIQLPLAIKEIHKLKTHPQINSHDEATSYSSIHSLISKLKRVSLISRLDFTLINICLTKISKPRADSFEKDWLKASLALTSLSAQELEERKQEMFSDFVELHEKLLQRRVLQEQIAKEDRKPKERTFTTRETKRETKYDRRRAKETSSFRGEEAAGASRGGGGRSGDVICPIKGCGAGGGHPRIKPPMIGASARSVARCPVLANMKQEEKLQAVKEAKACPRCLATHHSDVAQCKLPKDTDWLRHGDCQDTTGNHHPLVCSKRKLPERTNKTMEAFSGHETIIVNLAEENTIRDQSGASHKVVCLFDSASDSAWISESLAKTFPRKSRKKITLELNTIPQQKKITTYKHTIQLNIKGVYQPFEVYEAPSIGQLEMNTDLKNYVEAEIGLPVHFASGEVGLMLGLKNLKIFPKSTDVGRAAPGKLELFKSETCENRILAAGSIESRLIGAPTFQVQKQLFTQAQLLKSILSDQALDVPARLCIQCQEKTKKCFQCNLPSKPTSLKDLKEIQMVKESMIFDKKQKRIFATYKPTSGEWRHFFPPELSNIKEAKAISLRTLRSLKKTGQLKAFQKVFSEFLEQGIFEKLEPEKMQEWDDKKNPSNWVSIHGVKKAQTDPEKLSLRIVCNSSINRDARINDEIKKASLNSLLPQAKPSANALPEIALRWMTKKTSLVMDVAKAYTSIHHPDDEPGNTAKHLRRIYWFENPEEDNPKPAFFTVSRVFFGDAVAAAMLQNVMMKISEDLDSEGKKVESEKILAANYIDDFLAGVEDTNEAFHLFEELTRALDNYGAKLHKPIVSNEQGVFDSKTSEPRKKPLPDEAETVKILGFNYHIFEDRFSLTIPKTVETKKRQGSRERVEMKVEDVDGVTMTMRKLSSYLHSIFDELGYVAPLVIEAKILMSKVQKVIPPVDKESWDKTLPEPLQTQAKDFIKKMLKFESPKYPRFPPPGTMDEVFVSMDGGENAFGSVVHAMFEDEKGERKGKLLYAKPRVGHRSIPCQEISSFHQATNICTTLKKVFPNLKKMNLFADSEASLKQVSSCNAQKDVFMDNRVQKITSNIKELEEAGTVVNIYQVPSHENQADPITKVTANAEEFVKSQKWLEGADWMRNKDDKKWPVLRKYRYKNGLIAEVAATTAEDAMTTKVVAAVVTSSDDEQAEFSDERGDKGEDDVEGGSETNIATDAKEVEVAVDYEEENEVAADIEYDVEEDSEEEELNSAVDVDAGATLDELQEARDESYSGNDDAETETKADAAEEKTKAEATGGIFTRLLENVSRPKIAVRTISRIKSALRGKSFKHLNKRPSEDEERSAWKLLLQDQQKLMSQKILQEPKWMHIKEDSILYSRQKWSEETHKSLFDTDKLPLVEATSRLGRLLIADCHRGPKGPCLGVDHSKLKARKGLRASLLVGGEDRVLKEVRQQCACCRRAKIAQKGGTQTCYKPQMAADEYKKGGACGVWKSISCDSTGPFKVCLDTAKKETRSRTKYELRHILVIVDNGGSNAVKLMQVPSTSAKSFAIAIRTHAAETGQIPEKIHTDAASGFLAVAKTGKKKDNVEEDDENLIVAKEVEDAFPNTTFTSSKSNSQWTNGGPEAAVAYAKRAIKSMFELKPNAPMPSFKASELDLTLKELSYQMNERPVSYLAKEGRFLNANMFIMPNYDQDNESNSTLNERYKSLTDRKKKMNEILEDAMRRTCFVPAKWKEGQDLPVENDIVLISRGRTKVDQLGRLEYGLVLKVEPASRILTVKVIRSGSNVARVIDINSRNAHLIHRPMKID